MKKKFIHINLIMMLAVLFATCYQSIHVFSHEIHNETSHHCCDDEILLTKNIHKTSFSEKEDCPVCDFKFAGFLSPEIYVFGPQFPFFEIPYSFNYETQIVDFKFSTNCLRGPPCLT